MLNDINALLEAHQLDALLVMGGTTHNPALYYFANGAHLGERSLLLQVRGKTPLLICVDMERANAAESGLRFTTYNQLGYPAILNAAQGDAALAFCRLAAHALQAEGLPNGRVAWFGQLEAQHVLQRLQIWQRDMPHYRVVRDRTPTVLERAMQTKSLAEVARLQRLATQAMLVVRQTYDFLAAQVLRDGVLCDSVGQPITIGAMHHRIELWSAAAGLVNPHGFIFAIGHDAALPHARGTASDVLAAGKTIVFDFFPQEPGGGYFFDFTRTWCLGQAPADIVQAHQQVCQAQALARQVLATSRDSHHAQLAVLDYFEQCGHPTQRSHPDTNSGYVHSLGHGVGLALHEFPTLTINAPLTALPAGTIVTVEPGLYYPEHGWGIRIEDYLWLDPATEQWQVVGDFPKDLMIAVQSA